MKANIALIGFMGTGKTAVGKALAAKLSKEFIDMDLLIETRTGKSIPILFSEGEIHFRELEMELTKEISQKTNVIISTGGGLVLNKLNIDYLRQSCDIVLLEALAKTIFERITKEGKESRPLLNKPDPLAEIQKLIQQRRPFYDAAAEYRINTTNKSIDQIVGEILDKLNPTERNTPPVKTTLNDFNVNEQGEFLGFKSSEQCFICKQPIKNVDPPQEMQCSLCETKKIAYFICSEGHFVCDKCYSRDVAQFIEARCQDIKLTDPVLIAKKMMEYPKLSFSGPEIAMIVSGSFLLAVMNAQNSRMAPSGNKVTIPKIIVAVQRANALPGNMTAYYGIDSAAIGFGLATAVFLDTTPKKSDQIALANKYTDTVIQLLNFGRCEIKDGILKTMEKGKELLSKQFGFRW